MNGMNRKQRLWVTVLGGLLALMVVTIGVTLARELGRATPAATGADPFMGAADPSAPYDLRFLDEMLRHHEGTAASALGMLADSSRPEMGDLAQRIITGQQRQIDQMRAWRQQWYPDAGTPPIGMDQRGGRMGGGTNSDAADRMFLRMMIPRTTSWRSTWHRTPSRTPNTTG
jgi:uncharacterized protein (DUF305 family)